MTLVIAHRGASADEPEQTREAYAAAIAQGADGVECDVRLTADGVVVCLHDGTLDRTSTGTGAVHELTLDELRAFDYGARGRPGTLLTLEELLGLARGARRPLVLAIELKHPNPFGTAIEAAVLEVLDRAGWDARASRIENVRVSLMSFNPESIEVLATVVPAEHLMVLTGDLVLDDVAGELPNELPAAERAALAAQLAEALRVGRSLVDAGAVGQVGPDIELVRADPELVRGWLGAGRTVRVWTVDDAADIELCVALGVSEITTDAPARARAALDEFAARSSIRFPDDPEQEHP
ncbi:glycerophosphodiester phosphodiesterase [Glaciibacter flavus]|uniref:Glycerophosphodiester phosphodiesterase n=1 Tax=Orlajensenia flava TaxID=2565934 RepID=A0A4S4FWJ2_9MICO|nr:glycerophosphodiester phosphodiesterase family protein [Glaciibacter flavus]THG34295.1 glycerophosphodiester phosphodiesterase [Glaciibacter flavus]